MTAKEFAQKAHENQFRENGEPYFNHVYNVAKMVSTYSYRLPSSIANTTLMNSLVDVAFLHDVVEDTSITLDELRKHFDKYTCDLVDILTRRKDETYYSFIMRIYSEGIVARYIKSCDILHNMSDASQEQKMGSRYAKYEMALYILNVL